MDAEGFCIILRKEKGRGTLLKPVGFQTLE